MIKMKYTKHDINLINIERIPVEYGIVNEDSMYEYGIIL